MDVSGLIGALIQPMKDDLAKLQGDTGGASRAADSLGRAASSFEEIGAKHSGAAREVLGTWYGEKAGVFQDRVAKFDGGVDLLARNATAARDAVGAAVSTVESGRTSVQRLITEFTDWATPKLSTAAALDKIGAQGAVLGITAAVTARGVEYQGRSTKEMDRLRDELKAVADRLAALQPADFGGVGDGIGAEDGGTTTAASAQDGAGKREPSSYSGPADSGGGEGGSGGGGGGGGGHSGGGGGGGGGGVGPRLPVAIPPQPGTGVGVNLPDGSSAEAPNEIAAQAVRNALSALGTPYVWGGQNPPQGTDCSGLTKWAYAGAGLDIPRLAQSQTVGASVPAGQLLPGDLVVWDGHVAMVIGNGQMVEAGDPVQVGAIRTDNIGMAFYGFYRPTG
ncbi:C40 family peptidase [Actinosynnema pretiosum subsp. pretiosum]|uniref:C40 family peptidase n=1 Tax=Actinosynnema pretiosum subsp. pretiosum TaxID=103721 RepID=A0AA45L2Z1_9PSEU|nr:C40 family peptidase [Actinosynnema pretiosum subsp. pretiosum]